MVAVPPVEAARWPSRASPSLQRVHQQRADEAGVAEAHLGLGRMHVHVDLARRQRHEQRHDRMAVARQVIGIGAADGADQQLVAHRAAVDEQILPERIGAAVRRQPGIAFDHGAVALGAHFDGIGAEVAPSTSASRASRPAAPGSAAGQVTGARSSLASVKATSGRLMASRRTTSRTASASLRSLLRNFSRAGVA